MTVAAAQAELGHDVAVFAPAPTEDPVEAGLPPAALERGVKIFRVPVGARSRTQVFLHSFRQTQLQRSWQMVLEDEQPDLVHIEHLMGLPFSLAADLQERHIPYVVTLHDYWYVCANAQLLTNNEYKICSGPDSRALNCARCALARAGYEVAAGSAPVLAPVMSRRNNRAAAVLTGAAGIIAPTRFVRDIYHTIAPDDLKIDVVPHGIDLPAKAIEKAQRERREKRQGGRLHVGYIGSIAWQKGVHVLVSAINSLPEDDFSLTVYGDLTVFPEYTSELEGLVERPGIEFRGSLTREALWTAITDFDVVVIPTLWYETSVLVIDEVHALGVPVIGSDIGVMSEKIADGVNGRLFAAGEIAALRDVLTELLASPETLLNWRQRIEAVNSVDAHIRALEEIYAGALNTV